MSDLEKHGIKYDIQPNLPVNPSGVTNTFFAAGMGCVAGASLAAINQDLPNIAPGITHYHTLATSVFAGFAGSVYAAPKFGQMVQMFKDSFDDVSKSIPKGLKQKLNEETTQLIEEQGFVGLLKTSAGAFAGATTVSFLLTNGLVDKQLQMTDFIENNVIISLSEKQREALLNGETVVPIAIIDGERQEVVLGTPAPN